MSTDILYRSLRAPASYPATTETAASYEKTVVMPEPAGLIRIDWWGQEFPTANVGKLGWDGRCRINIDGAIWEGPAYFRIQGSSSAAHPKKNISLRIQDGEGNRIPMQIGSSVPSIDWVWKCDYTDASKAANLLSYLLFRDIIATRKSFPKNEVDLYWLSQQGDSPKGQPTGAVGWPVIFPAVMYHNEKFYGIGNILLKQDTGNKNVFEDDENSISFEFDARGGEDPTKDWAKLYPESPHIKDFFPKQWTQARINAVQNLSVLINGTQENFNNNWHTGFYNKQCLVDYYLYAEFLYDYDGVAQDLDFVSYDAQRFFILPWDKDTVFGIPWNAAGSIRSPNTLLVSKNSIHPQNRLWVKIRNAFEQEIEERYAELRDLGVFSEEWILSTANEWLGRFSKELFEMEMQRWPGTFVPENNVVRIANWVQQRLVMLDNEFNYEP